MALHAHFEGQLRKGSFSGYVDSHVYHRYTNGGVFEGSRRCIKQRTGKWNGMCLSVSLNDVQHTILGVDAQQTDAAEMWNVLAGSLVDFVIIVLFNVYFRCTRSMKRVALALF